MENIAKEIAKNLTAVPHSAKVNKNDNLVHAVGIPRSPCPYLVTWTLINMSLVLAMTKVSERPLLQPKQA